jgi:hypothetical protein
VTAPALYIISSVTAAALSINLRKQLALVRMSYLPRL